MVMTSNGLTERLRTEIQRRMTSAVAISSPDHLDAVKREGAYLATLKKVVELHDAFPYFMEPGGLWCSTCGGKGGFYPCTTLRAVAEGLGVELDWLGERGGRECLGRKGCDDVKHETVDTVAGKIAASLAEFGLEMGDVHIESVTTVPLDEDDRGYGSVDLTLHIGYVRKEGQ